MPDHHHSPLLAEFNGYRTFSVAGPTMWNSQLRHLCNSIHTIFWHFLNIFFFSGC